MCNAQSSVVKYAKPPAMQVPMNHNITQKYLASQLQYEGLACHNTKATIPYRIALRSTAHNKKIKQDFKNLAVMVDFGLSIF